MKFYDKYVQTLEHLYPQTAKSIAVRERLSETLVSAHVLQLPTSIRENAARIVSAFHKLRESKKYQDFVAQKLGAERRDSFDPGNYSALMCFDFHYTENKELKLIEINTNASVSLIGDLLYRTHGIKNVFSTDFRAEILKTFQADHALACKSKELKSIAIIDQEPEQQRLYLEFLLYKELFETAGIKTKIEHSPNLKWNANQLTLQSGEKIDLVYNRDTDFYFDHLPNLKQAWLAKSSAFSPNPHEYALLANKERLENLSAVLSQSSLENAFGISAEDAKAINDSLLKTVSLTSLGENAWAERKKYFFKPARSFGGKAVYRGGTMSKTAFENNVVGKDYVAQEFAPPSTVKVKVAGEEQDFKYDLRFFTYRDQIQLSVARLYQGQTTNAQTPGGGITAIAWT